MGKRILVVNKFYYPRGGDCVCTINLERLLLDKGHTVGIFSMNYSENNPSEFSSFFASNVDFGGGIGNKINAVKRILGYGDIKESFSKILNSFKPDVVHFNNIHSYLSPVIVKMAHEYGAKVVWTLHDYKLICPAYNCLRNNEPCELCYNNKSNVLKNKCMKGSLVASVLAYIEAKKWDRKSLEKWTDTFICPSEFMNKQMHKGGFAKLKTICNFIDPKKLETVKNLSTNVTEDYFIYVGRLSNEKGIETLLEATKETNYKLKIAGGGPLKEELEQKYKDCKNIEFLGHCDAESVANLLSKAKFSVVPSEWYENNPLSVIEALCAGTPVVGTNIGGIPELINTYNGIIVEPKNGKMLKEAIENAYKYNWNRDKIKEDAIKSFSPDTYYDKIIKLYS